MTFVIPPITLTTHHHLGVSKVLLGVKVKGIIMHMQTKQLLTPRTPGSFSVLLPFLVTH